MAQPTTYLMKVDKKQAKKEEQATKQKERQERVAHHARVEAGILRKLEAGDLSTACFRAGGPDLCDGHPDLPKETLLAAVANGWLLLANAMLDAGADTSAVDMHGKTSLMYAAIWGFEELTARLLRQGADPNATDRDGAGALGQCRIYSVAIVRALLEAGADVNARDVYGVTPLMHAAHMGLKDVVRELLALGADPHAVAVDGETAFGAPRRFRCIHDMLGAAGAGPFKGVRRVLYTLFPARGPSKRSGGECWC